MTPFDFSAIRTTAIGLVGQFGRQMNLLRPVEAAPLDASKPWRVGDGTTTIYPFLGVYSSMGFPKTRDPIVDQTACDIIVPGNVTTDSLGGILSAPLEPLLTDRIQIIGVIAGETDPTFAIQGIQRIDPDGNAIIFKCRCTAWPLLSGQGSTSL